MGFLSIVRGNKIIRNRRKKRIAKWNKTLLSTRVSVMVTISNRDKNMIIWNFMEELCDKDQNAGENNLPTDFKLKDFYNMDLLSKYLLRIGVSVDRSASDSLVLDTLKKYTDRKHLIEIEGDWVSLTKKGVVECQKSSRAE